jgi:6-phosphofructokinase 2
MGIAAGSAAVMSPGTELCREEDVQRLLKEVRIEEVAEAVF